MNIVSLLLIVGAIIGYFTYRNYQERGLVAALFYFASMWIVQWIIMTDRLPWYCWLILLFGISYVLSGFKRKGEASEEKI